MQALRREALSGNAVAQVTVAVLRARGLLAGEGHKEDIRGALAGAAAYPVAVALCELWRGSSDPGAYLEKLRTQAQASDPTAQCAFVCVHTFG